MALGSGCHGNKDLVESELRSKDNDLRLLRDELDRSEVYNRALQQELHSMRVDGPGPGPGDPDKPVAFYPLHGLTLGRPTGGHDIAGCPGDGALQVVLEPRDIDNHVIKVAASALIQVLEFTPEGLKHPLSTWEIPPDQLRNSWRQGLLSTGYTLILPWKAWPSQPKLRVVAQLRVADGRLYEGDKDIVVRLVPPAQRLMQPADGPVPGVKEDPLFPRSPGPEQLPGPPTPGPGPMLPTPAGPGPVLPTPAPMEKPSSTNSGGGNPSIQPVQSLFGAVQIHRPVAVPAGW